MRRIVCKLLFRTFVVVSLILISLSSVLGQQFPIKGIVKDEDNLPLPGVSVVVAGSNQVAITDEKGVFSFSVIRKDAKLTFSYVGYKTKEVPVGSGATLEINLEPVAQKLDDVVVVGYGVVRKKDLTGAVATVSGADIADRKQISVSQSLQGAVAGVRVSRSGGDPDASASIRIRGVTTIGDSNPLIIIDGIPGNLDWVSPNDIESVTVLKDAASASIYGSRAASGVILVTTKRAKSSKLSLDYNYDYTIESPTEVAKNVGAQDYMRLLNERDWNDANNPANKFPVFSEETINNYKQLNADQPDLYPDVDWMSMLMKKTARRQSHNINLMGGNDLLKSKASLMYDQSEGLYHNKSFDRVILNSNNNFKISDKLSAQFDLRGLYSINENPIMNLSPSVGVAPIYAAVWSDGRIGSGKTGTNPWASINQGGNFKVTSTSFTPKLAINYKPINDLTVSATVAPELYWSKSKKFRKKLEYSLYDNPAAFGGLIEGNLQTSLEEERMDTRTITTQVTANYLKTINDHSFNAMVGNENYSFFSESLSAERERFNLSNFPYLNLGNENYQYNSGSAFENAYRSFFGRIMYNYKSKYYFQANIRYDGSSRFHRDYRWGGFPSVSAGWVISNESFLKQNPYLSFLKLRASYGSLGNERIGNYPYQSTIGYNSALLYQGSQIVSAQTAAIMQYAISSITWEKTSSIDIGLDARFFGDKLSITGDYYKKSTSDMLLALEIPAYIGLGNPDQNTGKMHTKGWEMEVQWKDQKGKFGYSIAANLSDSRSVMGNLGGTEFLGSQVKYEGSEFNEWYGFRSLGLYQNAAQVQGSATLNSSVKAGDVQYMDISGPNGVPDGKISAEYDRVLLGGSLPRYLFGGTIRANYSNFDFSFSFQGVGKQKVRLDQSVIQPFRDQYKEVPQVLMGNYWSMYNTDDENLKAKYPRISNAGNTNNYVMSDFWMINGAYLRIKNIMLGYTMPESVIKPIGFSSLYLFFNVSDLPAFHHYPKGWDPEGSSYWISTSYTFGAKVRF